MLVLSGIMVLIAMITDDACTMMLRRSRKESLNLNDVKE